MNKLTNEEIAKVFAMYLGCEIENKPYTGLPPSEKDYFTVIGKLIYCIPEKDERLVCVIQNKDAQGFDWDDRSHIPDFDCKLLLTPLDKISDEDAEMTARVLKIKSDEYLAKSGEDWNRIKVVKRWIETGRYMGEEFLDIFAYQYLISKGYAVPLWFGVEHWANGKTAIELGIAIDKTLK